jgi:hypothetical protein
VRRICHYVTGHGKVWMTDSTSDVTAMPPAQRDMIAATYLLIRNGTSYIMLLPGLNWYPEYEIDLGGYVGEPPDDIEQLRVAGQGGAAGGLYVRQEVSGVVIVNSSTTSLTYDVASPMNRAQWSGGGAVGADGTEAVQSLTYDMDVPAGPLAVGAQTAVILRSPSGVPAPGLEPVSAGATDAGSSASGNATTMSGGATSSAGTGAVSGAVSGAGAGAAYGPGAASGVGDASPSSGTAAGASGGHGCQLAATGARQLGWVSCAALAIAAVFRRRRAPGLASAPP